MVYVANESSGVFDMDFHSARNRFRNVPDGDFSVLVCVKAARATELVRWVKPSARPGSDGWISILIDKLDHVLTSFVELKLQISDRTSFVESERFGQNRCDAPFPFVKN